MEILRTQVIAETKHLNLNMTSYVNNKGAIGEWVWVERPNDTHAVVIAAMVEDKLVLIREFRIPIGDYEWGIPAGLVDLGEKPETTVIRELKEETGLDFDSWKRPISPIIYSTAGITNEGTYMAFVNAKGSLSNKGNEATEDIQTFLVDRVEARSILKDHSVKIGAKAYFILDRFATFGDI